MRERNLPNRASEVLRKRLEFALMLAPNATIGITAAVMSPILPDLSRVLGGDTAAQLATSIVAFGMITGGFVSGKVLNLLGTRAMILLSLSIFAVSGGAGALYANESCILISRFVLGVAAVCFSTAAMALAAASFSGERRSAVIGYQQAVSQGVNVVGIIAAGVLAGIVGWRSPFVLLVIYGGILFAIGFWSVSPRPVAPQQNHGVHVSIPLRFAIFPVCALTALMGFLTVVTWTQLPFILVDSGFGTAPTLSLIGATNFVFATTGALIYGPLTRRMGRRVSYTVGLVIGTIGIALMGKVSALPWFYIASGCAGLGTGLYNSFVFDFGVDAAPAQRKAEVAGYLFSFMCSGFAFNPLIAGRYQAIFGLHAGVFAIGVSAMALGLLGAFLKESHAQPAAAAG